jgi:hypothetical protein
VSKKRKGPGRPSKLTPEVRTKLLDALRAGNFRGPAAFYAGVSSRVLREWMTDGKRNPSGPHGEFRRRVLEAEKGAEIANVANILKAAQKGDWKAAAWWLERKANARWGRHLAKAMEREAEVAMRGVAEKAASTLLGHLSVDQLLTIAERGRAAIAEAAPEH